MNYFAEFKDKFIVTIPGKYKCQYHLEIKINFLELVDRKRGKKCTDLFEFG